MQLRRTAAATGAGLLTLLATAGVAQAQPSDARNIYGVTSNGNRLVVFPANAPQTAHIVGTVAGGAIQGLGAGEIVVGIDFRPVDTVLYALTNQGGTGRLYTVDKTTAVATLVTTLTNLAANTTAYSGLSGSFFDIGFNPAANALRIVSNTGQNLRVPAANLPGGTGTLGATAVDTALSYPAGDTNAGKSPAIAAFDYSPVAGGTTTLYDVDYALDSLARQGGPGGTPSPNGGALTTIGGTGGLGIKVTNLLGLDAEVDGTFYASAQTESLEGGVSNGSSLYTVNTSTGQATSVGAIGGDLLDAIAIDNPLPTPAAALPEFGIAALAPVSAVALAGGVLVLRRRRTAKA